MSVKKKYYVIWKGRQTGIFDTWEKCKINVDGFAGAQYKSYNSLNEAEQAFSSEYQVKQKEKKISAQKIFTDSVNKNSICVDGAWNTATLDCEYRGIDTETGKELFKKGPFKDGTNNVAEFLALVHALAYCKKNQLNDKIIYSDSRNAIGWIKKKKCGTTLKKTANNKVLFTLIERAEQWLKENSYTNKILKWETKVWGENLADFGRK